MITNGTASIAHGHKDAGRAPPRMTDQPDVDHKGDDWDDERAMGLENSAKTNAIVAQMT